jgi:hypothetical protein
MTTICAGAIRFSQDAKKLAVESWSKKYRNTGIECKDWQRIEPQAHVTADIVCIHKEQMVMMRQGAAVMWQFLKALFY